MKSQGFQRGADRPHHHSPRQDRGNRQDEPFINEFKKEWVSKKIDTDAIEFSRKEGEYLARNGLTTSQIRIFFGELRRIQMQRFDREQTAFLLLKPKLAYAVKRHDNKGIKRFYDTFSKAYDEVNADPSTSPERFNNLIQLFEAILAYHKFYGGN